MRGRQGETPRWTGADWPASLGRSGGGGGPGTSMGAATSLGMGTSPFGRSVDMVDVVTQLMEAGGALPQPIFTNEGVAHFSMG